MGEDILTTAIRIANGAGLGVVWTLGLILAAAILIVVVKKVGVLKPAPVSPDPQESNVSPPMPMTDSREKPYDPTQG
jgi:hypothetical protein